MFVVSSSQRFLKKNNVIIENTYLENFNRNASLLYELIKQIQKMSKNSSHISRKLYKIHQNNRNANHC